MTSMAISLRNFFNLTYPGGAGEEDGWTPDTAWSDWSEVTLAESLTPTTTRLVAGVPHQHVRTLTADLTPITVAGKGQFTIDFVYSLGVVNASENHPAINPGDLNIRLHDSSTGKYVQLLMNSLLDWHDSSSPQTREPGYNLRVFNNPGETVYWVRQNNTASPLTILASLPGAGSFTFNRIRLRFEEGVAPIGEFDSGNLGAGFTEMSDAQTQNAFAFPSGFVLDKIDIIVQQHFFTSDEEFGIDQITIGYRVNDSIPTLTIGMFDDDGNVIIGVDPNDDGSGESSGGGGGLGGAGDGGIANGGLVGSGSEGNVPNSEDALADGEYGASAWSGSGTGINILAWNATRILDSFGYAEIDLSMVDSFNYALNTFKGRNFLISDALGDALFRGYVKEVDVIDDYSGRLILEETHAVLQRRETKKNFLPVINQDGSTFGIVTAISTTKITIKNGSIPGSIATDSTFAALIIPGDNPGSSFEDFDDLVEGTGTITDVNNDDNRPVARQINSPGDTDSLIIEGTYSGVRADLEALKFKFRFTVAEIIFANQTVHFDMFDYVADDWEEDIIPTSSYAGSLGIGDSAKTEIEGQLESDVQRFIGTAGGDTDKFKLRFRIVFSSFLDLEPSGIALYFADIEAFSNPLYDGSDFPITGKTNNQNNAVLTVGNDPLNSGVGIGDTVVIGKRNDLVLAELALEFFNHYSVEVDSNFTNYTASDFLANNMTSYDAIRSVLKKESGLMYFVPSLNTLIFRKRANLDTTGVTLSDRATDAVNVKFHEQQSKTAEEYIQVQVTGSAYKKLDGEVNVYAEGNLRGSENSKILRINAPEYASITEARNRVDSEIALIDEAKAPVHNIEITENELGILKIGNLFDVKRRGTTATSVPLRMINISNNSFNNQLIMLDLGWKGTSFEDREIEEINENKRLRRATYRSMVTRPQGNVTGNEVLSHDHIGMSNIQEANAITATGAGTTVAAIHKTQNKYGLQVTPNDNAGTFTSATIDLFVSFDGEATWHRAMRFVLNVASAYSDFTNIDNLHSTVADNDWLYNSGTDLLTDSIDIRYDIIAISLIGDADVDIILLKSR